MEQSGAGLPDIITYRIPRIEVYQVSDDELGRIEEGCGRVALDLTFALASGSVCVTLIVALLTGTFTPRTGAGLLVAAIIFAVVTVYCGIRWYSEHDKAANVIAAIRRRKVDPQPPQQTL